MDFLAGGGYRHFVPQNWPWGRSKREDDRNILQEFHDKGYRVFVAENDTASFRNYEPSAAEKVIATFTYSHLPYEIDRKAADTTPGPAEITQKAIDVLSKYQKGFFLMVEGGRIDHASHANDPAGVIQDVIAFDEAIANAYEFYKKHPNETLIVVVGDHETGGFGLGFGQNYFLKLGELSDVKVSVEDVLQGKYTGDRDIFDDAGGPSRDPSC